MHLKKQGRRQALLATALVLPVLSVPVSAMAEDVVTSSKRSLNANGSTSMNYNTEITGLGAQLGLDMSSSHTSVVPQPVTGTEQVSGTAYARVPLERLPQWLGWQKGAVNVVVNPSAEESRVATSFSRTWTVNDGLKATLSDSYEVARSLSGDTGWNTDKSLSVKLEDTGTTLAVGAKASDSSSQFLGKVSAQQQIYGNLNVTTSVSETTDASLDKSIKAGFTHRW